MSPSARIPFTAARRSLAVQRSLVAELVSISELAGSPAVDDGGNTIGSVLDAVVLLGEPHPRVTGFILAIASRSVWVHVEDVSQVTTRGLTLQNTRFDMRDVVRRPGEVMLLGDVIDHQLVDIHGVRVVRASDLYLALWEGSWRLVGVDISMATFIQRTLPRRLRGARIGPVLDWAGIHSLSESGGGPVQLAEAHSRLQVLGPAEVAELLPDLGHSEAQEFLQHIDVENAADAL